MRLTITALLTLSGILITVHTSAAQTLEIGPAPLHFTATADSPALPGPREISIGVIGAEKAEFKFAGAVPTLPGGINFAVVSPSSGVTPGTRVWVALNPNIVPYLGSGSYVVLLQFATPGQSCAPPSPGQIPCAGIFVSLTLNGVPPPSISAVVSAASMQPTISPGEIVSIFGTHLGTPPVTAQYDTAGLYPTDLSHNNYEGTNLRDGVTFNGIPAPLLYVSTTQINAQVPYEVAGQSVNVVVTHNLQPSPPISVPLLDTAPALFTVTQNGKGQGAILNTVPSTVNPTLVTFNGADSPAAKGSAIVIYATGSGLWNRKVQDGSILLDTLTLPTAPVSLTIGGQPARILYAGGAPFLVSGVVQVNAIVPDGIGSGPQPVALTIGQNSNLQQQVTVAVQ